VLALPWLRCRAVVTLAVAAGVVAAGGAFAAFNEALYGTPLGVVGLRRMEAQHVPWEPGHEVLWLHLGRTLWLCPIAALAAAVSLASLRVPALRADRRIGALWIAVAVSLVGAAFLSRHSGGDQIGARFALPVLPPLFALVALQWNAIGALAIPARRALRVAILALLAIGIWLNAVGGTRALVDNYRHRIRPALEALRADENAVVAVEHQWMAQELAAAFASKTFFRIRTPEDVGALARALLAQDVHRFTLVSYRDEPARSFRGDGFELAVTPRGRFGSLVLVDGELSPLP